MAHLRIVPVRASVPRTQITIELLGYLCEALLLRRDIMAAQSAAIVIARVFITVENVFHAA